MPLLAAAAAPSSSVLLEIQDPELREASGIAVDPDSPALFMLEDAGNAPAVFAVGPSGETVLTLNVPAENEDWEGLALGTDEQEQPALFIGDIGDAYFVRRDSGAPSRTEYSVIRVRKPRVDVEAAPGSAEAQDVMRWSFVFADGKTHNGEALLVQPETNRIFVVDKSEEASTDAFVWVAPSTLDPEGVNEFTKLTPDPVPVTGASGGAFSAGGDRLVLRNADTAYVWGVVDGDVGSSLRAEPTVVPLPPQRQGEGVAFATDGAALLVNSEGGGSPVYAVPLPEQARAQPATREPVATATAITDPSAPAGPVVPSMPGLAVSGGLGMLVLVAGLALRRSRRSR